MDSTMKEAKPVAADEMFPEGAGYMEVEETACPQTIMVDLSTNEKHVHADYYNDFGDLFDEEEDLFPIEKK